MTEPTHDSNGDGEHGMSRRQLMRHSAWFGGAVILTVTGGEVISHIPGSTDPTPAGSADLRFVQVSDSHIGFHGPPNMNVTGTFTAALTQINSLGFRPDFVMHSGDLTHLSTPAQFDQVKQMLSQLRTDRIFTVPGEHDSIGDNGRAYRQTFAKNTLGDGWYSFDTHGVHFIALVNTLHLEQLGHLGSDQIDFVRKDIAGLSSDTPIVVFSHIPLFAMYPKWGWGTDDAVQVLSMLRRFSSVTCLNGHVHQLFTKTEGNITFHSAAPTCYPFPKPGHGPGPIPQVLPAGRLKDALGIRTVNYRQGSHALAVKDEKLT